MPTEPVSKHATPREVAQRYAVTVPTVLNWLHAGLIPAKVAIGRVYRFDLEEVDEALSRISRLPVAPGSPIPESPSGENGDEDMVEGGSSEPQRRDDHGNSHS